MGHCLCVKNLLDVNKDEQIAFLNSFDFVCCDVDGVLWTGLDEIKGSVEAIDSLIQFGKVLYFTTNNATVSLTDYLKTFNRFHITMDNIIRPDLAIVTYLKEMNFEKEIYVIGERSSWSQTLTSAGYKCHFHEEKYINNPRELMEALSLINPNTGAVILDVCVNLSFVSLQKCIEYISRNNALFIVAAWDPIITFQNLKLIGVNYFMNPIEEITQKKAVIISKPSDEYCDIVKKKIGTPTNRVLVIGDSIATDMKLASKLGYKKLLTLTGSTEKHEINDWKHDKGLRPDYYVNSLEDLRTVIENFKS